MTNQMPDKIMAWRSPQENSPAGAWAETRYPEGAVEALLRQARDEALEKAAFHIETIQHDVQHRQELAAAIRAMKGEGDE